MSTAAISAFLADLFADGIGSGANQNLDCAPQDQYFNGAAVPQAGVAQEDRSTIRSNSSYHP